MRQTTIHRRSAWEDRWSQPSIDQLLDTLNAHQRRALSMLMAEAEALDGVRKEVIWYGDAWKWTLQFTLNDSRGKALDTLCYVVPRTESPLFCVPLDEAVLEKLPLRRLPKIVREGIRSAKFAVSTHWATWTPSAQAEATQLGELVRRKHKLLLNGHSAAENN